MKQILCNLLVISLCSLCVEVSFQCADGETVRLDGWLVGTSTFRCCSTSNNGFSLLTYSLDANDHEFRARLETSDGDYYPVTTCESSDGQRCTGPACASGSGDIKCSFSGSAFKETKVCLALYCLNELNDCVFNSVQVQQRKVSSPSPSPTPSSPLLPLPLFPPVSFPSRLSKIKLPKPPVPPGSAFTSYAAMALPSFSFPFCFVAFELLVGLRVCLMN